MICARTGCFEEFVPYRSTSKYCSPRCRTNETAARWRSANPERSRAATRRVMQARRAAFPEHYRAIDRGRAGDPRRLVQQHEHRVRRRAGGGYYNARDTTAHTYVAVLQSDPCCYCGASMREIDHIVPISLGGGPAWDNLTAACTRCNRRKLGRPLLTFLLDRVSA